MLFLTVPDALNAPIVIFNGTQVIISWFPPNPVPGVITHYDVAVGVTPSNLNGTILYSGLNTSITIPIPAQLDFNVRAATSAGNGPYTVGFVQRSSNIKSTNTLGPEFYIPVAVGGALLIIVILLVVKYRRQKQQHQRTIVFKAPRKDGWEVDPSRLTMGSKLGKGQFGIVFAATIKNIQADLPGLVNVAVKTLAEDATVAQKNDFIAEAELMKRFSKPWNENVC